MIFLKSFLQKWRLQMELFPVLQYYFTGVTSQMKALIDRASMVLAENY